LAKASLTSPDSGKAEFLKAEEVGQPDFDPPVLPINKRMALARGASHSIKIQQRVWIPASQSTRGGGPGE
jgi:hypothetical protein